MFQKVLVANRGEIAVRILRTCRDLGLRSVALYEADDRRSLHVRIADECVQLKPPATYRDGQAILRLAVELGVDAIHPGYGYLACQPDFIAACQAAGIQFIGPDCDTVARLKDRRAVLRQVRQAGFLCPDFSEDGFGPSDFDRLNAQAERIGYPLVIKSTLNGGPVSTWVVPGPAQLKPVLQVAFGELEGECCEPQVFIEQAILPARQVRVQLLGDQQGNLIHLGERDGSLQYGDRKVIEESPSPALTDQQRQELWDTAVAIARLFDYHSLGTVEFLVDQQGRFYFIKIKTSIQVGHSVTELVSNVDLVSEQIRIAAGKPLRLRQSEVRLQGCAMQCRVNAVDPGAHFLPSPGFLRSLRLPGGPNVRVDTYVYSGFDISERYDSLLAKLSTWGPDRSECLTRLRRVVEETSVIGIPTDLPLHQYILARPDFLAGEYNTSAVADWLRVDKEEMLKNGSEKYLRDLAIAAAIAYARRTLTFTPVVPERFNRGWHKSSRRLGR